MPGISQHTGQDGRDLELLDSVHGSVTACANISRKLDTLSRTTAACLSGPLGRIISGLDSMSHSYTNVENLLQRREPVWSQSVSLSIRFTQERCQQIAAELSTILGQHGEWDVLAVDGSYHHLNLLSESLNLQKLHHDLLFRVLTLVQVCSDKPPEHGSPASLFSLAEEYYSYYTKTERAFAHNIRKFTEAARIGAQGEMDKWSTEHARSLSLVRSTIGLMKEHLKELLENHVAEELSEGRAPLAAQSEDFPGLDDWSSTQSTTGIMTPTEDWSEVGSVTTETGRAPAITRHSLQLCGYAIASFVRLIEETEESVRLMSSTGSNLEDLVDFDDIRRLDRAYGELVVRLLHGLDALVPTEGRLSNHSRAQNAVSRRNLHNCIAVANKFLEKNNMIEESFGHLPGSTPVDIADIKAMHCVFEDLVFDLLFNLAAPIPFQDERYTLTSNPAPAPAPAPAASRPIVSDMKWTDACIDEPLLAIIQSMEDIPTEKDIMKLVFHWTTLNECNGFTRADVMKLN